MTEENAEKIICKDCGFEFLLTEKETKKFLDKGWEKPKRCSRCREKNRLAKFIDEKVKKEVTKQLNEKLGNKEEIN